MTNATHKLPSIVTVSMLCLLMGGVLVYSPTSNRSDLLSLHPIRCPVCYQQNLLVGDFVRRVLIFPHP